MHEQESHEMQKAHKGNLSQTDIEAADFSKSMQNPGSHNGHELELMLRGLKPMALFIAEDVVPPEAVGDAEFSLMSSRDASSNLSIATMN